MFEFLVAASWLLVSVHCDVCQDGDDETCSTDNADADDSIIDYREHILSLPLNYDCENIQETKHCQRLQARDVCTTDPGYMSLNCAHECGYCHLRNPKVRCQRHPKAQPAVRPGDIDKMFERLLTDFPQYSPTVLSRDPWLVLLHDVFTETECNALIEIGGVNFHRSKDAGSMTEADDHQFESVVSDVRTSSTNWCVEGCFDHPVINGMAQKAENITLIPKENSEYFQVLRYEPGQYYKEHHDFIADHVSMPQGPRIYTFYIYLNDVEQGGGTRFPHLNATVEPKRGSVAIWPSVLNSDPLQREDRANHEALPVERGVKYGANMWLHMYNFQGPFSLTCTG